MGGHRGEAREKIDWPKENVTAFVEIIYEKVKENKLQTSTFTKDVWDEINRMMIVRTNEDYGRERLTGKWNRLRLKHRLFAALIAHTGVTWNPDTNKVDAPEEVWQQFYAKNKKEYNTLRKEGCEHYHILSEIFGGTTASGVLHHASTQEPPTSEEERRLEDDFLCSGMNVPMENINENADTGEASSHRKKKDRSPIKRRSKASKIDKLGEFMEKWSAQSSQRLEESKARQLYLEKKMAQIETQSSEVHNTGGTSMEIDPYSLEICMDIINKMEELSDDSYSKATKAFQDASLRKTFMMIPESRRMGWLDRL